MSTRNVRHYNHLASQLVITLFRNIFHSHSIYNNKGYIKVYKHMNITGNATITGVDQDSIIIRGSGSNSGIFPFFVFLSSTYFTGDRKWVIILPASKTPMMAQH